MNQPWNDFLADAGAREAFEHFGDPGAELVAARQGTVLVPLVDQGLIRATGEDAASFLNNLLTNDIAHLEHGQACHAGLCTPKGRLLATFTVWRDGPDYLLQISGDILPGILKKLSMYVLRSKVKLADVSAERLLIGLAGREAAEALARVGAAPAADMRANKLTGGVALRLDAHRFVLALEPDAAMAAWRSLAAHAKPAGLAAWRLLEIGAGQPRVVAGTQEAFVPQMINFETAEVGGVSFKKGCYPGQEIVARTQYLGKVKRRMYRARLDAAVAPGTDVFTPEAGDQHCGAIVSVAPAPEGGYECLLVVQSSGAEAGEVHVGSPSGPRVSFLPLPYTVS